MSTLERKIRALLARCVCLLSHGSIAWALGRYPCNEPRQFIVRGYYFKQPHLFTQWFKDVGVEVRHRCPRCGIWHSAKISLWRDIPETAAVFLTGAIEYTRAEQLPNKALRACFSPEQLWGGLQRGLREGLRALQERADRKQHKKVR